MKTILNVSMLIITTVVFLASCSMKMNELKEYVDRINRECPISFGDIMILNSVTLDENTVVMKYTANETIASISALNNHKEETKDIIGMSLTMETCEDLVKKIIDAEANIKVIIVGAQSNTRSEILLTAGDLKKAIDKYSNMSDNQKFVASNVLGMKIKLPLQIDEYSKLVGITLTDDALIYKYEINDFDGEDIEDYTALFKTITIAQLTQRINDTFMGQRNRRFFKALIDCNQGIEVVYHDLQTGKRTTFRISTDEIQDILNGRPDNNEVFSPDSTGFDMYGDALDVDTAW